MFIKLKKEKFNKKKTDKLKLRPIISSTGTYNYNYSIDSPDSVPCTPLRIIYHCDFLIVKFLRHAEIDVPRKKSTPLYPVSC